MPIRKLAFEFGGRPREFWCDIEDGWYPSEYKDIIEGAAYPFYEDVRPGVVLDIGANIGVYSLMASLVWPTAVIHAFEPAPDNYSLLVKNLQDCGRVIKYQAAVGPVAGTRPLYLDPRSPLCHSLFYRDKECQQTVNATVVAAKDLPTADLIKLDIEGPELQVLEAMDLDPVKWLYVEFHCEEDRLHLDHLLLDRFYLRHARISRHDVGEVMYQRRCLK
jgi:FkbM family methyltransferase